MKRLHSFLIFVFFGTTTIVAQDKIQYASMLIPDSIKKEANAIVREYNRNLVIKSPGKGRMEIKEVVTVLNEKGKSNLTFQTYTDKFRKIDDVEILVYDSFGKFQKKYKKKDLEKVNGEDEISLVMDVKVLYGAVHTEKYPVTVETSYSVDYNGMLEYEDFYPEESGRFLQSSKYSITTNKSNPVRFYNFKCSTKPTITNVGDNINYVWEVRNAKSYVREPGMSDDDRPCVYISPTQFEMDDYRGDMSTWENFGKWQISLINQTNQLPEQSIPFYKSLVKDAKTEKEKVKILYSYLQENFRYVSIQLGIGGWKPFPAEFTEKKKYGDCKALSNYMHAMLRAVDIRSHYAIINAGYDEMPVDKSFPRRFSNHIILCVPLAKDTVWLECTDRQKPFGKLGSFTENRNAFLITETGGTIVSTPKSKPEDNVKITVSRIKLDETSAGKASVNVMATGEFTDEADFIYSTNDQNRKNYLINSEGFKQPDELTLSKEGDKRSSYRLLYEMSFEKVADFSAGTKHFLNPRLYKFWNEALPKSENRQNSYYLHHPLILIDTTYYELPEGYVADNLPKPASVSFPLGSYQTSYSFSPEKRILQTTAQIKLDTHIIPASSYQDAARFFSEVLREQQQKLVIKKE